jgi:transposase
MSFILHPWHRELIAQKWDHSKQRVSKPGRPPTSEEIIASVLQMARENPNWGCDRIVGALANLGHEISDQTVGNILKEHGIDPAPERKRQTTWKTFIQSHWDVPRAPRRFVAVLLSESGAIAGTVDRRDQDIRSAEPRAGMSRPRRKRRCSARTGTAPADLWAFCRTQVAVANAFDARRSVLAIRARWLAK